MIVITEKDYRQIARCLLDEIGAAEYFNGTIECSLDECYSTLTASLIIYRSDCAPADIVPVWWEFDTSTEQGEQLNDFSFSTFKEYIFE